MSNAILTKSQLAQWGEVLLRVYDFLKANPTDNPWVEASLSYCASQGYLFVTKEEGVISGVAIIGPISWKTLSLTKGNVFPHDFESGGEVLAGIYMFIDSKYRKGEGLIRFQQIKDQAVLAFPNATHMTFNRSCRNDMRPRVWKLAKQENSNVK